MRLRIFLAGLLIGLALAFAAGSDTWTRVRNALATAIDAVLRTGVRPE